MKAGNLRWKRLKHWRKRAKIDEVSPTLEKIRFLATANGKSMQEMVDALVESQDKQLYSSILAECDGNEALANRLFDAEKLKRKPPLKCSKRKQQPRRKEKADHCQKAWR